MVELIILQLEHYYYPTPPPTIFIRGGGGYIRIALSVRPSVVLSVCPIVSAQYLLNRLAIFFFFTKLGMVAMCLAEKLVRYLESQGRSEGLYNQKMTIFTILSKLLVRLQTNLV